MKRASTIIATGDDQLHEAPPAGTITLPRSERYRRRIAWQTDQGTPFLLDLAEATYLPDGTGLALDDGGVVLVRAAPEDLLEITAPDDLTLMRITWHIGNRHTPAEIGDAALYIQPDHVLADMVRGLGGFVAPVHRPFEPEGGAYGGHGSLQPSHHHHHAHDHA